MQTQSYLQHLQSTGFSPRVILDIGANIGEFKQYVSNIWPAARVIMFEANNECISHLTNVGGEFYIKLLGNENKIVDFFKIKEFNYHGTGNSIYKENSRHYQNENYITEQLEMIRLDDMLSEDLDIDLVKIDTQGSELDIIRGGLNRVTKAKYILLEVAITEYNSGAPQFDEVIQFMSELGYTEYVKLDQFHDAGKLIQVDCLFSKPIQTK
jgi:FkbM family methyltransferase